MALEGYLSDGFTGGELGSIRDCAFWTRELRENMVEPYRVDGCVSGLGTPGGYVLYRVYHVRLTAVS